MDLFEVGRHFRSGLILYRLVRVVAKWVFPHFFNVPSESAEVFGFHGRRRAC